MNRATVSELLNRWLAVAELQLSTRVGYEGYIDRVIRPRPPSRKRLSCDNRLGGSTPSASAAATYGRASTLPAMLVAIILAVIAAIVIPAELLRRPFRSAFAWARKWFRLIRQLPRLEQAVERLAAARAHEYSKG